ncbi:MAG: hypothetical protein P8Y58_07845 [Novosphingobium sp.]
MNIKAIIAGLSLAALPVCASAHGSMEPVHGGLVTMSGETKVELVRGAQGVDIYLSEEDEPLAASGFTGKLTIVTGTAKTDAALVAGAGNKMTAPGLDVASGAKVIVALASKASGSKTFATFMVQ